MYSDIFSTHESWKQIIAYGTGDMLGPKETTVRCDDGCTRASRLVTRQSESIPSAARIIISNMMVWNGNFSRIFFFFLIFYTPPLLLRTRSAIVVVVAAAVFVRANNIRLTWITRPGGAKPANGLPLRDPPPQLRRRPCELPRPVLC